MIQPTAPTLAAGLSQVIGNVPAGAAKAAGMGSFSAILGDTDSPDTMPAEPAPDTGGALAALLPRAAGNALGKIGGKTGGKILPDTAKDLSGKTETDTETDSAPVEATPADVSLTLAGILSLPVPPLPGTSPVTITQSRAAGPVSTANTGAPARAQATASAVGAASANVAAVSMPAAPHGNGTANDPAVALAPIEILAEGTAPTTGDRPAATAAQLALRASAGDEAATAAPIALSANGALQTRSETGRQRGARVVDPRRVITEPAAPTAQPVAASEGAIPLMTDPNPAQASQAQASSTSAPAISTPTTAGAASAAQPAEAPQDFATLVARLAEAREAASPHLVRTAITHAEFGQISLQFRHEDSALSVTMASSDPGFAGAVQAAASATLASGANGDSPAQQQQPQHYSPASAQQQAAASGAGTGQNQQSRADQAGQTTNREQATTSRPQDHEASAPRQTRDGTRRGGIYA